MEPGFIHRANIERFEQLLASGSLSVRQRATVTALLEKETEALDRLTRPLPPNPDRPQRLSG